DCPHPARRRRRSWSTTQAIAKCRQRMAGRWPGPGRERAGWRPPAWATAACCATRPWSPAWRTSSPAATARAAGVLRTRATSSTASSTRTGPRPAECGGAFPAGFPCPARASNLSPAVAEAAAPRGLHGRTPFPANPDRPLPDSPASTSAGWREQPHAIVERDGVRYTLLGTAHVSHASVQAVREAIGSGAFDAVAVELDEQRLK